MTRPWTESTSTTIVMKRACNGCDRHLGDVTDQEMARGINGLPLPDVRKECPDCGPTAPEPKCVPFAVVWGDQFCVEMDCSHELAEDGGSYCDEVTEQTVCLTHSAIDRDGQITHAAAWPCTHTPTSEGAPA